MAEVSNGGVEVQEMEEFAQEVEVIFTYMELLMVRVII